MSDSQSAVTANLSVDDLIKLTDPVFSMLPPVFRDCCWPLANTPYKFDLRFPYIINDYIYATDGHKMVKTKSFQEVSKLIGVLPREGKFPDCEGLVCECSRKGWEPDPVKLPIVPPLSELCSVCKGKGRLSRRQCSKCHGTGVINCYACGQDCECSDCEGKKILEEGYCYKCDGLGHYDLNDSILISNEFGISPSNLMILYKYKANLYLPKVPDSPARFTIGDSIEGFLMKVRIG